MTPSARKFEVQNNWNMVDLQENEDGDGFRQCSKPFMRNQASLTIETDGETNLNGEEWGGEGATEGKFW